MTLSLNARAHDLADAMAAEAEALRISVTTSDGGARVIDCGAATPGGLEAGRRLGEVCMGGLGWVTFVPLSFEGTWLAGLGVATDHPARACLGAQYAGWKLEAEGYFAMASGPGRALVRAEELYDDLDVDEHADAAVFCLETGDAPPDELAADVAKRAGVDPARLTLLYAPTASIAGSVQVGARVVETALHKLHELDFPVGRVTSAFGTCPLPPVSADDGAAIGRTNDAVLYGGQVHLHVDADDDEIAEVLDRLPAEASSDFGQPFGEVLKAADWDFYKIDPLLFSPAEVRLSSTRSGRSHHAGAVRLDVLERSFWG
jgi:methenyltetrahydromethanopterin cyclohydrolase